MKEAGRLGLSKTKPPLMGEGKKGILRRGGRVSLWRRENAGELSMGGGGFKDIPRPS